MIHPIDYRYGSEEMRTVFSEDTKLERMLEVEVALVEALAELGKVPKSAVDDVRDGSKNVKLERVKEIEKETKHDVMAVVKALTEVSGDGGKYVHLTATSYDIVDTAQALQLRDALEILLRESNLLLEKCLDIAEKYKATVMIGRTHGQHAIPITLGFKFANYADKLGDDILRLDEDAGRYVVGKFSGAVGNYSAQKLYGVGDDLERKVMGRLGIAAADISTQVVARENLARILSDIVIYAGTVEQIAKEIRNLQRTEIGEVAESFGEKQVGSSTMAQKRNPINTENVCSNVRVIRSCLGPALENIALEHERDLTNSAAERSILPTAFVLADEITTRMTSVLDGLVVSEECMHRNLELSGGTIMAEAVITELAARGMPRQEAHELLRKASASAVSGGVHLSEILRKDGGFTRYVRPEEFGKLFDYNSYIGLCVEKTDGILRKWRK